MRYFKQYGTRRTGTNYLRALLEKNFTGITVLMHTLGDKHGVPVDLHHYLSEHPLDPVAFTEAVTAAIPAENSLPFTEAQQNYMKLHALKLRDAIRNNQLHYLVSIKEPYAWVNSMFKYWMHKKDASDPAVISTFCELVRQQCAEYNFVYKSYWELFLRFPEQTTIVHYDKLVSDPFAFLENLRVQFQLTPLFPGYSGIDKITFPTDWDQDQSHLQLSSAAFDEHYYLQRKYMDAMRPEVIATLEAEIDWKLVRNFGYEREGGWND